MKAFLIMLICALSCFTQSRYIRVFKSGTDAVDIDKLSIKRTGNIASFKVRIIQGRLWHIHQVDIECYWRFTRVWNPKQKGTPYWIGSAPSSIASIVCS